MRSIQANHCPLCGYVGWPLYKSQKDKLFGVLGVWNIFECTKLECKLLWLNPMPIVDDIFQAYTNYYTHAVQNKTHLIEKIKVKKYIRSCYLSSKYGYCSSFQILPWLSSLLSSAMYLFPSKRSEADFSVMYLPAVDNGRLLEIGCGSGAMLKTMSDLGWKVEGVEVDPEGVVVARAKGLTVHWGDVYTRAYPDNSFDAVTLSHVIEHVHDPARLICECTRILKPGGKLVVVTPNSKSLGHSIFKSSWLHLDPPRHLHIFNSRNLEHLACLSGLVITSNTTIIRDANTLFIASHSIRKSGKYAWGSDGSVSTIIKILAKALQLYEYFYLKICPLRGEEIALVATKE